MGDNPRDLPTETEYNDAGVPTFESVRDKIERRVETSIGARELDEQSTPGRTVERQFEEHQRAAADRLEEIRRSMHEGRS